MEKCKLWEENVDCNVEMEYYPPLQKASDSAVVIFPGGGYRNFVCREGAGYAQLLNTFGITAFVVNYRIYPNKFPLPLMDAPAQKLVE